MEIYLKVLWGFVTIFICTQSVAMKQDLVKVLSYDLTSQSVIIKYHQDSNYQYLEVGQVSNELGAKLVSIDDVKLVFAKESVINSNNNGVSEFWLDVKTSEITYLTQEGPLGEGMLKKQLDGFTKRD